MGELRKLPRAELVSVLECAGNGRGLYRPTVAGHPVALWRGGERPVGGRAAGRTCCSARGCQPAVKHILFNGADVRMGNGAGLRAQPAGREGHAPRYPAGVRDERRAAHPLARLPAACGGAGLGGRFVGQVAHGDPGAGARVRRLLHEDGLPASGEAGGARHGGGPGAHGAGDGARGEVGDREPAEGEVLGPAPGRIRGAAWCGAAPVARVDVFDRWREDVAARPRWAATSRAMRGGSGRRVDADGDGAHVR